MDNLESKQDRHMKTALYGERSLWERFYIVRSRQYSAVERRVWGKGVSQRPRALLLDNQACRSGERVLNLTFWG